MKMETPNLMDVPTHATRRIERYGLLALILFLTTFGVLYLWDGPSAEETAPDTVMASGGTVPGFHPRSTARPVRPMSVEGAADKRATRPPLASIDPEQINLAMKQRARSAKLSVGTDGAAQSRQSLGGVDRNKMVRFYRRTGTVGEEAFDSPAPDVSVSGYSGRKEELREIKRISAPKKKEMEYLVKSGDCLSKIAQSELGSVRYLERLLEVNGLNSSSTLRVGQRLILPHIGETAPVRGEDIKRAPAPALESRDWAMVMVQEGDSLWKIAARVLDDGNRYKEIMAWNQLNSETLQPGTKLRVQLSAGAALAMGGVDR
jgi:nucleoid-associated protein YgaU